MNTALAPMNMLPPPSHAVAAIALLALAVAPALARADAAPTNDGMRFVTLAAQADGRHDRQALSTLSLPVGRHAWVQAGVGASRSDAASGGHSPGIVTGDVGLAGQAVRVAVNASRRADGGKYRQTDVGASLDWRQGGSGVGVDVSHRSARASGTVAVSNALGGSSTVPAQAQVSGTGLGVHGTLQASERLSVYAALARNHYRSSTRQTGSTSSGGLLARALLGGASVVNQDEAALDHSALVGATWRWTRVALSGEYATGEVHDNGGALRSVAVKAAIDVAPGWRVAPGVGRGTSGQGGRTNFASLSATYGW